jgi:hypothetical protein
MDSCFSITFSGYSMHPFLRPGDRLVVRCVTPEHYRVGDIVVLRNSEKVYTAHRLIRLLPKLRGITKGDSLLAADPAPVSLCQLDGRVEMVVRGRRMIPLTSGPRAFFKRLYAVLSQKGLTSGAVKLRIKNIFSGHFQIPSVKKPMSAKQVLVSITRGRFSELLIPINWATLKEVMHRQGLTGIVYRQLKSENVPASEMEEIKHYYRTIAAQNIIRLEALKPLEKELSAEKIEVMTLKGASLLGHIYPSVGLRPMEDLDLMVRRADRDCFVELLRRMGYRQNLKRANNFKKGDVVIDLHTHALSTDRIRSRALLFPGGMDPIWQWSISWADGWRWIRRPDDIDNILLLSQHYLKHYFSRLIWLEDIYRLLRNRDQRFWSGLSQRAHQLKQTKPLAYALYYLKTIFNFRLPENVKLASLPDEISGFERYLLNASREKRLSELLAVIMGLFCIPGVRNRLRFAMENLFPQRAVMKNEFGPITGSSRAIFYPARLLQACFMALRVISAALKTGFQRLGKRIF